MKALRICLLIWLATVGIALLCGYVQSAHVNASLAWPTTDGQIEVAQVDRFGNRYLPKLTYSYQVQGVTHTGGKVNNRELILDIPYQGSTDPRSAQDQLAGYAPGKHVSVHYDPAQPQRAWLVGQPLTLWQGIPIWTFLLQFVAATAVMQRLFVTRKGWLVLTGLATIMVLWISLFVAMQPP